MVSHMLNIGLVIILGLGLGLIIILVLGFGLILILSLCVGIGLTVYLLGFGKKIYNKEF